MRFTAALLLSLLLAFPAAAAPGGVKGKPAPAVVTGSPSAATGYTILRLTANQTVNASAWTSISWDASEEDDVGAWSAGSPTLVTVPKGISWVRITMFTGWEVLASGSRCMRLTKNGTGDAQGFAEYCEILADAHGQVMQTRWMSVAKGDQFYGQGYNSYCCATRRLTGGGNWPGSTWIQFEWSP